jgi:peptidyl-prolyl cis-trans isomerase A (cyclophilin A)
MFLRMCFRLLRPGNWIFFLLFNLAALAPAWGQSVGIYADFTTSMGSFTCRLEYATSPKAVANFVGLATGQRAWLDLPSGLMKTNPFYNGLLFHRVIAGFMNQGGSPNGLGTDGPGYAFVDEFSPSLRHDGFGVLSMANSGPDSSGSQFFITVSAQPQLDDVHTIFGRLVGGSNVVYAINHVATDSSDKPLTNVVIQTVAIRRLGGPAQAFDIQAQGLPVVTNLALNIARAGGNVSLAYSNRLYADNRLYSSTNLLQWTGAGLGIEIAAPISNALQRAAVAPREFFRLAQVQYGASTLAPKDLFGRTLTLTFTVGPGIITNVFNSSGGGTYGWSSGPGGTIPAYAWYQEPYRGRLWPLYFSGLVTMTLQLNFESLAAGSFSGTAYTATPTTVKGSFTLTGP